MNKTCLVVTEMVRFFCFSAKIHYHRSKKEIPQNKSMSKASEDYSKVQRSNSPEQDTTFAVENWDKPGEMHSETSSESNIRVHQKTGFKRSQSLGTLDREGIVSGSEDETDREIKCDKDLSPDSFQGDKEGVTNESIFSIEYTKQLEEYNGDLTNSPPHEYDDDTEHLATSGLSMMAKSCSLPDIGLFSPTSKDGSSFHGYQVRHCRSFEDLSHLNEKNKASQDRGVEFDVVEYQEREDYMTENTKGKHEDFLGERDGFESYNYLDTRDWATDEINVIGEDKGESSAQNLNALPSKDFKIKLIEEWVSAIELDESSSLQDISESHHSINKAKRGSLVLGSSSTAKLDTKNIHGMEAAKNYISALPPTATTAQLSNLGLAVVPFLSAFVHLKSLNLSGNAIVRITSGALPRGLHVLNLSKNNISSIEGLRELARLRVLNLSYNRILRIGHGLASCSSLKELYLAGNKISEVEGLHRLLKLNVLDLRFNKISTAKCLGQLAANYSSLQAINLEGNPAQRNVGDEQLKKYLQRCLPHLIYYNKKTIKATSSKEVADRAARLAIASHQPERGLRSEHNLVRKSNVSSGKASSSRHGHRFQAGSSTKLSKDIHGRLPPSGAKGTHHHHYLELGSKLLGLRSNSSMRRSRSEGNLGAP